MRMEALGLIGNHDIGDNGLDKDIRILETLGLIETSRYFGDTGFNRDIKIFWRHWV